MSYFERLALTHFAHGYSAFVFNDFLHLYVPFNFQILSASVIALVSSHSPFPLPQRFCSYSARGGCSILFWG